MSENIKDVSKNRGDVSNNFGLEDLVWVKVGLRADDPTYAISRETAVRESTWFAAVLDPDSPFAKASSSLSGAANDGSSEATALQVKRPMTLSMRKATEIVMDYLSHGQFCDHFSKYGNNDALLREAKFFGVDALVRFCYGALTDQPVEIIFAMVSTAGPSSPGRFAFGFDLDDPDLTWPTTLDMNTLTTATSGGIALLEAMVALGFPSTTDSDTTSDREDLFARFLSTGALATCYVRDGHALAQMTTSSNYGCWGMDLPFAALGGYSVSRSSTRAFQDSLVPPSRRSKRSSVGGVSCTTYAARNGLLVGRVFDPLEGPSVWVTRLPGRTTHHFLLPPPEYSYMSTVPVIPDVAVSQLVVVTTDGRITVVPIVNVENTSAADRVRPRIDTLQFFGARLPKALVGKTIAAVAFYGPDDDGGGQTVFPQKGEFYDGGDPSVSWESRWSTLLSDLVVAKGLPSNPHQNLGSGMVLVTGVTETKVSVVFAPPTVRGLERPGPYAPYDRPHRPQDTPVVNCVPGSETRPLVVNLPPGREPVVIYDPYGNAPQQVQLNMEDVPPRAVPHDVIMTADQAREMGYDTTPLNEAIAMGAEAAANRAAAEAYQQLYLPRQRPWFSEDDATRSVVVGTFTATGSPNEEAGVPEVAIAGNAHAEDLTDEEGLDDENAGVQDN